MTLTAQLPPPEPSRFQKLLREARSGSSEARWLVVQLFRNSMLAIANQAVDRSIHTREAPSDIVQETILEAQRDLDGFHGRTEGEMHAWLRTVLKRNLHNLRRKHRARKRDVGKERPLDLKPEQRGAPGIADPYPSPSSILVRRERTLALELAISTLPPHHRQIIDLRHRKGLSYAEIALIMGRSEDSSRQLWSRALRNLSRRVKLIDEGR